MTKRFKSQRPIPMGSEQVACSSPLVSMGTVTLGGLADPFLPWVAFEFMKTIKIKVKRKHIEQGAQQEGNSCPIQLAMRDVGFHGHHVSGGGCGVYIKKDVRTDLKGDVKLPKKAVQFIENFDEGLPVDEVEFNIQVPNKLVPQPLLVPE